MSFVVCLAVEQADHDLEVLSMVLPRASRGITHSATIGMGEVIDFSGVMVEITQIIHKHAPANRPEIAPNSIAYGHTDPLHDGEILLLRQHGFLNDEGSSDNAARSRAGASAT